MLTNIETLLRTLYNNRLFFETLFEKRNQIVKISELINEKIDYEKIQYFNEVELVSLSDDLIELDDRLIEFFEEFLDTSRDIKIGAIDDILEHLVFHISNVKEIKDYEKTKNDIKKIRRYLKQIPLLILKNIIQLSHHIGLVYKTQEDFKSKINALEFHKTRVEKLIIIKQKVQKILLLEEIFFVNSYDNEILQLQRDLKIKMHDLSLSLIALQKEVIEYINRSIKKVSFWQKVIRLKELRDNFELKEKTDILVLCEQNMPLKFSNLSTNFKTNLNHDLIYDSNYQDIVKKLLKNKKLKKVEQKYASKIDEEFLNSQFEQKYIIDTDRLNSEFLATNYNLFEFILYKKFNENLDDEQKIELFCKMLLLYEESYVLQNSYQVYNGFKYIMVYAK
ncbi:hypothetical protein GCM10012288_17850 [Malaciobacter pacificus]|uniref:Uncharacterized protein n=1 Tax=Malaciobacter pacificus TaxID=1080223 RepID=A0A5C2HDP6_9BACT|nr:hypothetical protein [Malaciobacter pacificus]QEP35286.1 hypothetical protein APAC_2225 [Malaciobacter pacificus]GGD43950.1 hypothetical protein GCM10012288_17850 [Malaciobacter pacificus]